MAKDHVIKISVRVGHKKRKTPIEHKVRKHKRLGKVIEEFQRGSGKDPIGRRRMRSRVKKTVQAPKIKPVGMEGDYRVRLRYKSNPNENFKLNAKDFQDAQRSGFGMSVNVEHPLKVAIRRI